MTTDQANILGENAISQLLATLEQGHSDALRSYLRVMSRFHRYSWGNVLMIYTQRPDATHVAGFHSWLKAGFPRPADGFGAHRRGARPAIYQSTTGLHEVMLPADP